MLVCGPELTCASSAWVCVSTFGRLHVGWECLVIVCLLSRNTAGCFCLFNIWSQSVQNISKVLSLVLDLCFEWHTSYYAQYSTRMHTHNSTTDGQLLILYITLGQMFVYVVISDRSPFRASERFAKVLFVTTIRARRFHMTKMSVTDDIRGFGEACGPLRLTPISSDSLTSIITSCFIRAFQWDKWSL